MHRESISWRGQLTGRLNDAFIIPRFIEFFESHFISSKKLSFLEIGAGMGDLTRAILDKKLSFIDSYRVTEIDPTCVEWLRAAGVEATIADGQSLPFEDRSFDVAVEFDVLHHVTEPRQMAREMMRVARGRCLMTESNGLSIFRKLRELTPAHRRAGEKSFTPAQWRSFFEGHSGYRLTRFEIFPFLFPLPSTRALLPWVIAYNRWIERAPFLKWQCSNVAIYLEYVRE